MIFKKIDIKHKLYLFYYQFIQSKNKKNDKKMQT